MGLELKRLLEEYFAADLSSGEWIFVGMIYTNFDNTKKPICSACNPFVVQKSMELQTKLAKIEKELMSMRRHSRKFYQRNFYPSHREYLSLVQGLTFVVLSQPISTHCTIAGDVHDKAVGKPAIGNKKAKAGQGDFQSIIFWTAEQSKIMLTEQQFVFFISPWSTGKTICMKAKAVMWATQNPQQKLFFVVVKKEEKATLLEMELKDFFQQQNNLQNVEVIGLRSIFGTLKRLLELATTHATGAWMVDELVMP